MSSSSLSESGSNAPLIAEIQGSSAVWSKALVSSIAIACFSSILYGYHMAELNAPGHYLKEELALTDTQLGFVTAIFSIGGLISSTFASNLSTRHGMKISFGTTSVFYAIGALIEARAVSYSQMLLGRFISGLGGGLAIVFVPLYVNETSPLNLRGFLGSMTQVSVNLGILLTQGLAILWSTPEDWRKILWTAMGISCVALGCNVIFLEESPKWLALNAGDPAEAREVLTVLRNGDSVAAQSEIDSWKDEERLHNEAIQSNPHLASLNLGTYLTEPTYAHSKTVATAIMLGQQFAGINAVIFYGVKILSDLFPTWAVSLNFVIGVGNTVITFVASLFLDSLGRKPLLEMSSALMGLFSLGLCIGIIFNSQIFTIVSIFGYVASFATGTGPIPFLLVSEVSQIEVKDLAQSWATDVNWLSVFAVGSLFPIVNSVIGGYVYLLFAGVCFLLALFTRNYIPETKGKKTYAEVWGERTE